MNNKHTILFTDYALQEPSEQKKKQCILKATQALKRVKCRQGLGAQLITQLEYTGIWFWLGNALVSIALLYASWQFQLYPSNNLNTFLPILITFSAVGPLLAALSAPVLMRSYSFDMWELEQAGYHNLSRLTALRLIICATAALPVLCICAFLWFGLTGVVLGIAAVLAPFLLANSVIYFIIGRVRGNVGNVLCTGACFMLALLFISPLMVLDSTHYLLFIQIAPSIYSFALILGIALFTLSAICFIKNTDSVEKGAAL